MTAIKSSAAVVVYSVPVEFAGELVTQPPWLSGLTKRKVNRSADLVQTHL